MLFNFLLRISLSPSTIVGVANSFDKNLSRCSEGRLRILQISAKFAIIVFVPSTCPLTFGISNLSEEVSGGIDQTYVTKLIADRNAARKAKDFKKSDEIRKKLSDMNIILEDTKEGTEWRVKA